MFTNLLNSNDFVSILKNGKKFPKKNIKFDISAHFNIDIMSSGSNFCLNFEIENKKVGIQLEHELMGHLSPPPEPHLVCPNFVWQVQKQYSKMVGEALGSAISLIAHVSCLISDVYFHQNQRIFPDLAAQIDQLLF